MAKHKKYYKREGGGFHQAQVMMNFVNMCLLVDRLCTKNAPTTH